MINIRSLKPLLHPMKVSDLKVWNYDGSSTGQAIIGKKHVREYMGSSLKSGSHFGTPKYEVPNILYNQKPTILRKNTLL